MPASQLRYTLAVVAVAAVAAGVSVPALASVSRTAGVPSNLCTLKVAARLKALTVSPKCTHAKTAKIGSLRIAGAHWGTMTKSLAITLYMGGSKSHFIAQFKNLGSPVSLGTFAREASGPSGVTLSTWVAHVGGLVAVLNHKGTTSQNNAYRTGVLAFAKAVVKQL